MIEKLKPCLTPVLPTSYSEALSYLEDIDKLRNQLNNVIKVVNAGQTFYVLPIATETELGGVKAIAKTETNMNKVAIDADGQIWSSYPEMATDTNIGLVKAGVSLAGQEDYYNDVTAMDEEGTIWYHTPQVATEEVAGLVKAKIKEATQTHEIGVDTDGKLYSDYPDVASTNLGLVKGNKKTANQTTPVGIDLNGNMYVDTSVDIPQATGTQLGGVKANSATSDYTGDVRIDSSGKLKVKEFTLSTASSNTLGGVKADSQTTQNHPVGISNGKLYSDYPTVATDSTAGIVKAKAKTTESVEVAIDSLGKLYVPANAGIQPASDSTVGGIKAKVRTNEDRKVAIGDDNYAYYRIPQASAVEIGGIKAEQRTTETNEVKIDSVTGKLYASGSGITTIPKATSTTIGGIIANPVTSEQTVPVGIGSDGQLYTEPISLIEASKTNLGGIRVSSGGTDTGELPLTIPGFQPDVTNYPLLYGKRVPYSVNTQNGGGLETYGYELILDLSDTPADSITTTKLNAYVDYAENHAYELKIQARDNSNVARMYYSTAEIVDEDRVFVTIPFTKNNKLTVSYLIVNSDSAEEYAYSTDETVIEPEVILPARENRYGTIKAATRTASDTQEVKIDTTTGKLYTAPGGGDSNLVIIDIDNAVTVRESFFNEFYAAYDAHKEIIIRQRAGSTIYDYHLDSQVADRSTMTATNMAILYCHKTFHVTEWVPDDDNSMDIRVIQVPLQIPSTGYANIAAVTLTFTATVV